MLGLVFPMTKNMDVLTEKWNETAEAIWEQLSAGKDVAFVTEGDPLLYSTFIHLMNIMKERYPNVAIEIVPGVSPSTRRRRDCRSRLPTGMNRWRLFQRATTMRR